MPLPSTLIKCSHAAAWLLGASLSVQAAVLKEDFNAPFPAWESGWFATHSDAINGCTVSYCLVGGVPVPPGPDVRGNAGDGMWLSSDGGIPSFPITITFDPSFAASLVLFKLDVAVYVESTLQAWDTSGNLVFSRGLRVDSYKDIPTSRYQTLLIRSPGGISSFSLSGFADGNTVIDNLVAVTRAVPEPASAALLLGGLALAAVRLRHRRA